MKLVTLKDNKGRIRRIPASATIKDLVVKYGVRSIRISPPETPLPNGWFKDVSKP